MTFSVREGCQLQARRKAGKWSCWHKQQVCAQALPTRWSSTEQLSDNRALFSTAAGELGWHSFDRFYCFLRPAAASRHLHSPSSHATGGTARGGRAISDIGSSAPIPWNDAPSFHRLRVMWAATGMLAQTISVATAIIRNPGDESVCDRDKFCRFVMTASQWHTAMSTRLNA